MSEKSKPDQYVEYIRSHILPFVDYNELQASYKTDKIYAKGILNRLHEAMVSVYGSETLNEQDGDKGFVVVPGVLCGSKSNDLCIALFTLDLSSSGEHWGTDFLCKYGVISQDGNSAVSNNGSVSESEIKEIKSAYIPYDYCYTATIPCDIHVGEMREQYAIESVLEDFRNHRADLMFESEELQGMTDKTALRHELFDRLDQNLDDMVTDLQREMAETYKPGQSLRIAREIIDVYAAHEFVAEYPFSEDEAAHLLQLENPLAQFTERWEAVTGGVKSADDIVRGVLCEINKDLDYTNDSEETPSVVIPDDLICQIAKRHCRFETLETRKSDSLDFREVSVWGLKAALEEAYTAGLTRLTEQTRGVDKSGAIREDVRYESSSGEKPSVLDQIREAAKAPKEPRGDKPARNNSEPEH